MSNEETAARVVQQVGLERPLHLVSFLQAQVEVAEKTGVSKATARKRLLAAVETGLLVQIKPHSDWSVAYAIPGNHKWVDIGMDVYVHRNWSDRLVTHRPEGRMPVASSLFLVHPDQLTEISRIFQAEAEAIAAKSEEG